MSLVQPHVRRRESAIADETSAGRRDWTWLVLALAAVAAVVAVVASVRLYTSRLPGDGSAEAGFARDMAAHHDQAVTMAQIILDRTSDPAIKTLAMDIMLTQQGQIGIMRGWLDVWGLLPTGSEPAMTWMGHAMNGPMPGMATPEELDHLRSLSGPGADAEFLRLMIRHHEGGLPMAAAILDRTDREEVRRLAQAIFQSQEAEIDAMQKMLEERGVPADATGA